MRLSDFVPSFLRGANAPAVAVTEDLPTRSQLKEELALTRDRLDTMESMLSSAGDPDSKLPGNQNAALFRVLSGSGDSDNRDFSESDRAKHLKLCHEVYALRGTAHNILEINLDFVIGDGLKPVADDAKDTDLQTLLDEIWKDKRNRLSEKHEGMARTLYLEGERFMQVQLSKIDGHIEFGYLPPEIVQRVLQDQLGRDVYLEVLPHVPGAEARRFFILDSLTDQIWIEVLPATSDQNAPRYAIYEKTVGIDGQAVPTKRHDVHGLAFAWFENRPDGAKRGRTELLEILDYIETHDSGIWNEAEIEKLKRLFLLCVKDSRIKTPEDAKRKLEELGLAKPPKGPKVIAHNDQVEIDLLKGNDRMNGSETLERTLAVNIYGAKGFPEHFRGSGADANLSTAQAQELIPMKRLRRKQDRLVERFHRLVEVSIELRRRAGSTKITEPAFTIQRTEVGGKDKGRGATLLKDVVVAMSQATSDNLISREAANAVVVQTIRDVGFELDEKLAGVPEEDPNADLDKIKKLLDGGDGEPDGDKERVRGAA